MLKQRIITALILAPLAIAAIFLLPPMGFGLLLAVVMGLAAWEWAGLSGFQGSADRTAYSLLVAAACLPVALLEPAWFWMLPAIPFWLLAFAWLTHSGFRPHSLLRLLFGCAFLVATCLGITLLHQAGPWFVILVLALVAAADVGAYFAGKRFGRHRLAPTISPGKTWEGVLGGALLAATVALGAAVFMDARQLLVFTAVCTLAAVLSVGGDLVESILKRHAGVKDSGRLLPGHGGLLDRMDSLLVATPVLVLGLGLIGELS